MTNLTVKKPEAAPAPRTTVKQTFDCYTPTAHATVHRPNSALPFRPTALANLDWADAFIDQAGHLIKTQELQHQSLEKKYQTALNRIGQDETEIEKLKNQNTQHEQTIEGLKAEIARQVKVYNHLDEGFDKFRDRARVQKQDLTKKLHATQGQLNNAINSVKRLEAKLIRADKAAYDSWVKERLSDVVDHERISELENQLKEEHDAKMHLQEELENEHKNLLQTQQELLMAKDLLAQAEKKIDELEQEIESLRIAAADNERTINRQRIDNEHLHNENAELVAKNLQLTADLTAKTQALTDSQDALNKANEVATGLKKEIERKIITIEELAEQLADEKKQRAIEKEAALAASKEAADNIGKLYEHLNQLNEHNIEDDKTILSLKELVDTVTKERDASRADDEADHSLIQQLGEIKKTLEGQAKQQAAMIDDLKSKLDKALEDDEADKSATLKWKTLHEFLEEKVGEQAKKIAANIALIEGLRTDAQNAKLDADSKNTAIDELQEKIKQVTADDVQDKEKIDILARAKLEADAAIDKIKDNNKALQAQLDAARAEKEAADRKASDAEAAKKAAEEAAAKAANEHKDAIKNLENDLKLANPVAIVGSLKGSPRNIDDETFAINCPFPVKLFDHASSKIYVSVNGLFTLDYPSNLHGYEKLPYSPWFREGLPDYVLAPFWADLYIYKGTPQGVYYEVTGTAPARKLEVEWYVSRYGNSKQYYHFSLTVEESKPNVATFKYFEALDKGEKCTIGVQGNQVGKMFSHNQPKALPGTQVTFNTAGKEPIFTQSTFEYKNTTSQTSKPAVQDIKTPNTVTSSVKEIVL